MTNIKELVDNMLCLKMLSASKNRHSIHKTRIDIRNIQKDTTENTFY